MRDATKEMHSVIVTHTFLVERSIVLKVKAETMEGAVEALSEGSIDTPDFEDAMWSERWTLRSGRVEAAPEVSQEAKTEEAYE